ncbi:hypothetical protein T265_00466 [Opisthorchis viverrini]|uniref:Basement membrane-specific heparan sulfate proteoglycan core protein n=1 Tax=Opisthorchis viverrini TaxID=6198 RepID=A0A075A363_OPIVI|nr:hypothetical protein T265_00466 [Opisthorchis viverrini]KER33801.1 hypothetical protein T265_00466 [Opisthorchis viverrini]
MSLCSTSMPRSHAVLEQSKTVLVAAWVLCTTVIAVGHCSLPRRYEYCSYPEVNAQSVHLTCPTNYVEVGDSVSYYQQNQWEQSPRLLRTVLITVNSKAELTQLKLQPWSENSTTYCEVQRNISGIPQVVSRTDFCLGNTAGFRNFIYEPSQISQVYGDFGQPLELSCPLSSVSHSSFVWYRLPGYRIVGANGPTLRIDRLEEDDLGAYYCAPAGQNTENVLSKPVKLLHVKAEGHTIVFKRPLVSTTFSGFRRYYCADVPNELRPVTWEQPLGTVLLNFFQSAIVIKRMSEPKENVDMWCHYNLFEREKRLSDSTKTRVRRPRQNAVQLPLIKLFPRASKETLDVKLGCKWLGPIPEGQTVMYRWRNNIDYTEQTGEEITTTLEEYSSTELSAKRTLICQVESEETGEIFGSAEISLAPTSVRTIGTVDMQRGSQRIFSFEAGDAAQIVCDLDKEYSENTQEMMWTLNDGPLPEHVERTDRLHTSLIVIRNLTAEDEGVYSCGQKQKIAQVLFLQKPVELDLELQPDSDTRWANSDEDTEFRCRLKGREDGNNFISWYFLPSADSIEHHLPQGVSIGRPATTPSTSFLTIKNVQKYHEGEYLCRSFGMERKARLTVKLRALSVNPEQVDARPGTSARFLCELSVVQGLDGGKLFWMRTDRRDLRPGKEEVIGSTGGRTLLIVKSLSWEDNNTTYECSDGVNSVTARIFVRDDCPPGYRACNSRGCVESWKFCDGKQDCEDGSDELLSKCDECSPNEYVCRMLDGKKPLRKCYLQYWHCDGDDDCGNNFDEASCPLPSEYDKCNGTHFTCSGHSKLISRSFVCDGVADCEADGADEQECSDPVIIEPSGETHLFGIQSKNLTLTCAVYGRPPPAINWRFNWGGLRDDVTYVLNTTVVDCNKVISQLTLTNLEPQASGLYTCEAVNKRRSMAPDIAVNVAKGGMCTVPFFNDGATFADECLKCYCSGVTDKCQSAKGYVKSPVNKMWKLTGTTSVIGLYSDDTGEVTTDGLQITDNLVRYTNYPEDEAYLEGEFGLQGPWVTSYGYNMKVKIRQFGPFTNFFPGALIALHGKEKTIYWCPHPNQILLNTAEDGYENELSIKLNERDRWFEDRKCSRRLTSLDGRSAFMNILRDVQKIGVRVRNFEDQTSTEVQDVQLEYVTPSGLTDSWVTEVEQCDCPVGYEGLSCEICALGYQPDPDEPGKCEPQCACDKCDAQGNCINCPGNRAGPRCQHCQTGFYRPERSTMDEDCVPCEKCAAAPAHVVKECAGSTLPEQHYLCKCEVREDGKLVDPDCDQCALAEEQGIPPPPEAKCEEQPERLECNTEGTQSVLDNGDCVCKENYDGPRCDQCKPGFIKYKNTCLECYCAGQSPSCRLSNEHVFWNITMDEVMGQPRLERTPTELIVRNPVLERGIIHLAVQIKPPPADSPTINDIPIYRYLYGGQMFFRLDAVNFDLSKLKAEEARVVVELESERYGRVWTQAVYNKALQTYEVQFDENWWPGGWKLGTPIEGHGQFQGLTRAQLLRVLATTSSISIVTSSGLSKGLAGMKISGLSIQLAQSVNRRPAPGGVDPNTLPQAPVEVCDCPMPSSPDERQLSPSCEGCKDTSLHTVIRMNPYGPDFVCSTMLGSKFDACPSGQFKYNVYTGERFDSCQLGLTIDTKQRVIVVKEGDPVRLVCESTSYRGGIGVHEWIPPVSSTRTANDSRRRIIHTPSLATRAMASDAELHRSKATFEIESANKQDEGEYMCRATVIGTMAELPTYLIVREPGEPMPPAIADAEDPLDSKFWISVPPGAKVPSAVSYTLESDPTDDSVTRAIIKMRDPADLENHQLVWLSPNGSQIVTKLERMDLFTGDAQFLLHVPHAQLEAQPEDVQGYLVGKNPASNPFWTPIGRPNVIESAKDRVKSKDITIPPSTVEIPFMQPETLRVLKKPGKSRIRVDWKRLSDLPDKVEPSDVIPPQFPEGMIQEGNDLVIWAAAEQHEGVYEGVVYRDDDGEELKRFNVTIRVQPLNPGKTTHLDPGTAVDLPQPTDEGVTTTDAPVWDFVVQGFTPEAEYCEEPKWMLIDYQRKTVTDVTHKVQRLSPSSFRVEYPLTSGIYLRFQCNPVPWSKLFGEIKYNITSDDPRIVFETYYENPNSTFPTRLVCYDLNPSRPSDVEIASDAMGPDKLKEALVTSPLGRDQDPHGLSKVKVELDWQRIGHFDPFSDSGKYTCFVNNTEASGTRTVQIPDEKVPVKVPEDPFSRIYIYSPDTLVSQEVDGRSSVEVTEGDRLRLYCHYDARPASDFLGWSSDSSEVNANMRFTHKPYSSLVEIGEANLDLDGKTVSCKTVDKEKVVELKVISKTERAYKVKVTSEYMVGDRIVGTIGSDLELQCEVKQVRGSPVAIQRIDWFVQYPNGRRHAVSKSKLAQNVQLEDNGSILRFNGLTKRPTGAQIFCVARPVDATSALQAYHPSPSVELWIRSPNLLAEIQPLARPGVVVGPEAGTIRLYCTATDLWHNRPVENVQISWETEVRPENIHDGGELKTRPSLHDMPWLLKQEIHNSLVVGGLRRPPEWIGRFRCTVTDPLSNVSASSDWAVLEVLAASRAPKLRIIAESRPSFPFYPTRAECVDENKEYPSEVSWIRNEDATAPENVEQKPSSATIIWKVNGIEEFDPRKHGGIYTCKAVNPYSSAYKQIQFPLDVMPKEPIPAADHKLLITSSTHEILRDTDEVPYTRVIQGQPFELLCVFYGHPPPAGGLQWTVKRAGTANDGMSRLLMQQGLQVKSGRLYWAQLNAASFDAKGKHTGLYQCAALDSTGNVVQQTQVRVEMYKVNVKVKELTDSGLIEGEEGSDGVITCNAYDGYLNFILPDATYIWEVEKYTGERVHPNMLANTVVIIENRIEYTGLSREASNFRAKCVALNQTARYYSTPFGFRVHRISGEPAKRPTDIEPGNTRWIEEDGKQPIKMLITGLHTETGHASLSEGDNANLTCVVVDAFTNKTFDADEFYLGWRILGTRGEPVTPGQLASGTVETRLSSSGDATYLLLEGARRSPNLPEPSALIECLATRRSEAVTYYSKPIEYVVHDKETPDFKGEQEKRDERNRVIVKVTGLDDRGTLSASEGSLRTLECVTTHGVDGPIEIPNAEYSWEFIRLDGNPVDTASLMQPNLGSLELEGNKVVLKGLRQTSAIKGRCTVRVTGEAVEDQPARVEVYHSPYFRFDVTDDSGLGVRDYTSPTVPATADDETTGVIVEVSGLDEKGHLTASPGASAQLKCRVLNSTTKEAIADQADFDVIYGWEFQQIDGQTAGSGQVAGRIQIDSSSGQMHVTDLRAQSETQPTKSRCVVELIPKDRSAIPVGDTVKGTRVASPFFLINVPPKEQAVPDDVDVPQNRYELNFEGLDEYGALYAEQGKDIKLKCVIRDVETDTLVESLGPAQAVGWQLPVYPSGFIGNPGDIFRETRIDRNELTLQGLRSDAIEGLRGRAWFFDGLTYYYSDYFPIVTPKTGSDGRVRVQVKEIGADDERKYICAAYDAKTGQRLDNVSYEWVFTTPSGERIWPAFYFDIVDSRGAELTLRPHGKRLSIPENLKDDGPFEGRCIVLYQKLAGNLTEPHRINVYQSEPFILIDSKRDYPTPFIPPDPLNTDDRKIAVNVDGVERGLVTAKEGDTVTLTCQAVDVKTLLPVEGLSYRWEIQTRDGSSVSTTALAQKAVMVNGQEGNQLTVIEINLKSAGLRARCVVKNDTEEGAQPESLGLLPPGAETSSRFFEFHVTPKTPESKRYEYQGPEDYPIEGDRRKYTVLIDGLDDSGRLLATEGQDHTLDVKLKDTVSGEIKSIRDDPAVTNVGIETQFDNGQSAPFSQLADKISVHGRDGVIKLNGMRGPTEGPPIRFRMVVEREEMVAKPDGKGGIDLEKKRVRYGSDFVDVIPLKPGEPEPPVKPAEDFPMIYPVVDGLNKCGNLPLKEAGTAVLMCRPNDTRIALDDLYYAWEIRHKLGQQMPPVNLVAKQVKQQGNRLYLNEMKEVKVPLVGRCLILSTKYKIAQYSNKLIVEPHAPGEPVTPEKEYPVRIRIKGLDERGQVNTIPGTDVHLTCTVLDENTNEPVENADIGWEFLSDTGETLSFAMLARSYQVSDDSELKLMDLLPNRNALGRCVVTLEKRVTLSSPYFLFNVDDASIEVPDPVSPIQSDKRVLVEVAGLNKQQQIKVERVGDESTLRCQAIVVATSRPLLPVHGVRYGWEWRYLDEDPATTSKVAISVHTNSERLEVRGIQAPPGTHGRNVKGRCVVHVPANQVDDTLPENKYLVYGSEYFTVDVVKKPTTPVPDVIPIPGKPEDGIIVKVMNLDENGNLVGNEHDSVAVKCEVQNATTNQPLATEGKRAEYRAVYGWEFADVTGRSIDSSLFADSILADPHGNLRLRGLAGPTRGELPFKIRCDAVISKLPTAPGEPTGPAKSYKSEFFALAVTRADGTSTLDGKEEADISGRRIIVTVDGLRPDRTLTLLPWQDAELRCIAQDSKTGTTAQDVTYGWEFRRASGRGFNMGLLATNVNQENDRLKLTKVKPLTQMEDPPQGRCVVHRGRQVYHSDYFGVKIGLTPKGEEIEGDGRVLVSVDGADQKLKVVKVKPDSEVNLTCVATGVETGAPVSNAQYIWDMRLVPEESAPELKGTLGPFIESVLEQPNGHVTLRSAKTISGIDQARLRCRVLYDKTWYSSPFYRLIPDSPDQPPYTPDPVVYPKYRVEVEGLDADGRLTGKVGDSPVLRCHAYDAGTGTETQTVNYYWDFSRTDDESVASVDLVTGALRFSGNEVHLDGLVPIPGNILGRCLVVDPGFDKWDASPYFSIYVPEPVEIVPDKKPRPAWPIEANATDDRVTVSVSGLDDSGNLVGKVGEDASLTCNAVVKEGVTATVLSYGWKFEDENGKPITTSYLAETVTESPSTGTLELKNLKPSQTGLTEKMKGRCVVETAVTTRKISDGDRETKSKEKVVFSSKFFGVSVTEDGTPVIKPGGEDAQGSGIFVEVEGLAQDGSLRAETGDKAQLQCVAKYTATGNIVPDVNYVWEIRDQVGVLVPIGRVAEQVMRRQNTLELRHLRPTDKLPLQEQLFGRCVIYHSTTLHMYTSPYFHLDVRRPDYSSPTGPDDRVAVHVKGITEGGILVAEEGETVTLECTALDKKENRVLDSNEAIYQFQFAESVPDGAKLYGGHVADHIEQDLLAGGGIKITMTGIRSTWDGARCVVVVLPSEERMQDAAHEYSSGYFYSAVRKRGEPPVQPGGVKKDADGFTRDPLVLVKVEGARPNHTIAATVGESLELRGYAIDVPTGKPIEGMHYSWELRTLDNLPLSSNQLSDSMATGVSFGDDGQSLRIKSYRPTAEGVKVRLIATASDKLKDQTKHGNKYASPFYTFETIESDKMIPPKPARTKYDPEQMQVFVEGLNPDGTLSRMEGESVNLSARVLDKQTDEIITDDFDLGWSAGTGPDGRPIPLNQLADSVTIENGELTLDGLHKTPHRSGGLRAMSTLRLGPDQLLNPEKYPDGVATVNSDVFVIHVKSPDDIPTDIPDKKEDPPFINWIPGPDPKDAVIVKVSHLDERGSVRSRPGEQISLTCAAYDAVTLQKIVPSSELTPIFSWELRNGSGGQLLDYGYLASGRVIVTQPGAVASDEDVSRLTLYNLRQIQDVDTNAVGRCVVRLRQQVYHSNYFPIYVDSGKRIEERQDGMVEVIVHGLDDDGKHTVKENSDVTLNCEAQNGTGQLLRDDNVRYGWQLANPVTEDLKTPAVEKGRFSGPKLELTQISIPEAQGDRLILWGWCVVDVVPTDPEQEGTIKHYRSKPFQLIVDSKERDPEMKPHEVQIPDEFYIKISGIEEDGILKATEGSDVSLSCLAVETSSGMVHKSDRLVYGWEWRNLDGGLADASRLGRSIKSRDNELLITSVKPTDTIKGRCVVTDRQPFGDTTDEEKSKMAPRKYMSEFFFVNFDASDPEKEKVVDKFRPTDASDDAVIIRVDPSTDSKINLEAGSTITLKISAEEKDGTPVQPTEFGYELVDISGRITETGALARSAEFDSQSGQLTLTDIQYPTEPLKMRFHAQIPQKAPTDDEEPSGPLIYRSPYHEIIVETKPGDSRPPWTDREVPVFDVSGTKYMVKVAGLDENGNAAAGPNENLQLICSVYEQMDEVELKPQAYSWQFLDGEGYPVNLGNLASQVEVEAGRNLKLTGYRKEAEELGISGRCAVTISVPVPVTATPTLELPPTQSYTSPYFRFVKKKGEPTPPGVEVTEEMVLTPSPEEPETTPAPEEVTEIPAEPIGFLLKVDSSANPIYDIGGDNHTILARVQRPFELNCRAVFTSGGDRTSTGEQLPRLVWYYRQPEIPGDVPIPSQVFPVMPPRMETLVITAQENHKISIHSDAYSFRDDVAEFHCNAYMESGDVVAQKIVFVQKVAEKFNVRIFDEESRGRVYAFVGESKTLTCYVDEISTGERVEPESYQWEVSTGDANNEWIRGDHPRQPASAISGWKSKQLVLDSLVLPKTATPTEASFEFRCIVNHNATFDTASRPFVMNLRNKPVIESIQIDREKPTEAVLAAVGVPMDEYDAAEDYQLSCKPKVIGAEASATWQKCADSQCDEAEDLHPIGDKLFFFANSTRYIDEGFFRCLVGLQLKEYNFRLTESRIVQIKRKSPPAIYNGDAITYTTNDEMSLQCTDESSSPESTVKWTFEPSGKVPEERKDPILLGKTYEYGRIYIFAIARGQLMTEHSGKYTCTATNPFGSSSGTIDVTVTEDLHRNSNHYRIRRLVGI